MLSILYLLPVTQLFTEGVHASSDVKNILRNREICDKVPSYCTPKKEALMDDMADLVEITEDISLSLLWCFLSADFLHLHG